MPMSRESTAEVMMKSSAAMPDLWPWNPVLPLATVLFMIAIVVTHVRYFRKPPLMLRIAFAYPNPVVVNTLVTQSILYQTQGNWGPSMILQGTLGTVLVVVVAELIRMGVLWALAAARGEKMTFAPVSGPSDGAYSVIHRKDFVNSVGVLQSSIESVVQYRERFEKKTAEVMADSPHGDLTPEYLDLCFFRGLGDSDDMEEFKCNLGTRYTIGGVSPKLSSTDMTEKSKESPALSREAMVAMATEEEKRAFVEKTAADGVISKRSRLLSKAVAGTLVSALLLCVRISW